MARISAHGGGCCGARHMHGFAGAENNDPNLINRILAGADSGRMVEVILNGTQVRNYANILERLAALGFVYDGHWINNNHHSDNYRFTRCDRRRTIDAAAIGWNGMVANPGLNGDLDQLNRQVAVGVPGAQNNGGARASMRDLAHYVRPLADDVPALITRGLTLQQGVQVRVNPESRSQYAGREGTIASEYTDINGRWRITFNDGERAYVAESSLIRIGNPPAERYRRPEAGDRVQLCYNGYITREHRGMYGTVVRRLAPSHCAVRWDSPGVREYYGVELTVSDSYLYVPENPVPEIQPPAAQEAPAFVQPVMRHAVDEALGNAVQVVERVVQPERTRVHVIYHGVFRDGRRGAGFHTLEECVANLGRRTRIDTFEVFSDGTNNWNEDIDYD